MMNTERMLRDINHPSGNARHPSLKKGGELVVVQGTCGARKAIVFDQGTGENSIAFGEGALRQEKNPISFPRP